MTQKQWAIVALLGLAGLLAWAVLIILIVFVPQRTSVAQRPTATPTLLAAKTDTASMNTETPNPTATPTRTSSMIPIAGETATPTTSATATTAPGTPTPTLPTTPRALTATPQNTLAPPPANTSAPPTATRTSAPPTATNTSAPPTPTRTTAPPTPTRPPEPTRTNTPLPPTPTQGVATSGDIRIFLVGYAPLVNGIRNNFYEHIHFVNCDSKPINVNGWKVKSLATGDVFTFPSYVAAPGCGGQVQFTVNTHTTGLENPNNGLFGWDQPPSKEEWPDTGGKAELYDATGAKKQTCTYQSTADPTLSDVPCQ